MIFSPPIGLRSICAWLGYLTIGSLAIGLAAPTPARGALPADPATKSQIIGQPVSLQVQPETIVLCGPKAVQQLVITGRYADGTVRDLTPFCEWAAESTGVVEINGDGFLLPKKDGTTG